MNCIAIHHVRFEDLGSFAQPLADAGYQISYRHAGAAPLSEREWIDTDLIVVLGGPIGVKDTERYPWLGAEVEGLAQRLSRKRPTVGICLGAQLMATALGGAVVRRVGSSGAPEAEIGWSVLELAGGGNGADAADGAGPLQHLRGVPVLHWHGDNIVPPDGVLAAAATPHTPCQAFAVGKYALGLQFHAEFHADALEEWLTGHTVELQHDGVDFQRLREDTRRHGDGLVSAGRALMRDWLAAL
jgi:GMP synthase (glutamine-hydrolysing)